MSHSPGALPVAAVPTEPAGATTGEEDGEDVEEDGPPNKAANPPLVAPAPEEAATGANTSVRRRTTRYLQAGTRAAGEGNLRVSPSNHTNTNMIALPADVLGQLGEERRLVLDQQPKGEKTREHTTHNRTARRQRQERREVPTIAPRGS